MPIVVILLPLLIPLAVALYDQLPRVKRQRQQVEERVEQVMCSVLSPEQYAQLKTSGYLDIPSPSNPKRVYRIPYGLGMVAVLEGGRCVERLCAQPTASIPDQETVVIHKLMIEGDEQEYLRLANHFPSSFS